jgi:hypothetical protein
MDERANKLLEAGRAALTELPDLLGVDARATEAELEAAMARAQQADESWRVEAVRDILRRDPATQRWFEQRYPDLKTARPFTGGRRFRGPGGGGATHRGV